MRDGMFHYPRPMHFSQRIRIVGNRLYSIHSFGSMDGLFEFDLPENCLTKSSSRGACGTSPNHACPPAEGFDFVPGRPDQIWHALGSQVDRYQLAEFVLKNE